MDLEKIVTFFKRRRDPLLAITLFVLMALCLYQWIGVLAPFLIALVLAYLLEPVVRLIQRLRIGRLKIQRMTCVLVIYVLLFAAGMTIGLPILINVTQGMIQIASGLDKADLTAVAKEIVEGYQKTVGRLDVSDDMKARMKSALSNPKEVSKVLVAVFAKVRSVLTALLRGGAGILSTFLSASVQLLLVPVLLFYFMLDFETLDKSFLRLVPEPYREWMKGFLARVDRRLGGFVRGQLLIAFLFGVIMTFGLWIIGIRWAIILGPLSGIANLVPYLGVVVGLVPAFFIALWQGGFTLATLWSCVAIIVLFIFLQTLDGYIFQPRILGPSVELHPLWIMVALALGQHLLGITGMILAVPVAAVMRVILEDLYGVLYAAPA